MNKQEDSIIVPLLEVSVGRYGGPIAISSVLEMCILLGGGCFCEQRSQPMKLPSEEKQRGVSRSAWLWLWLFAALGSVRVPSPAASPLARRAGLQC